MLHVVQDVQDDRRFRCCEVVRDGRCFRCCKVVRDGRCFRCCKVVQDDRISSFSKDENCGFHKVYTAALSSTVDVGLEAATGSISTDSTCASLLD